MNKNMNQEVIFSQLVLLSFWGRQSHPHSILHSPSQLCLPQLFSSEYKYCLSLALIHASNSSMLWLVGNIGHLTTSQSLTTLLLAIFSLHSFLFAVPIQMPQCFPHSACSFRTDHLLLQDQKWVFGGIILSVANFSSLEHCPSSQRC